MVTGVFVVTVCGDWGVCGDCVVFVVTVFVVTLCGDCVVFVVTVW